MKQKIFFFLILFFLLFLLGAVFLPKLKTGEKIIQLGKTRITVEVADTEWKRAQGLSGRPSLPQNSGMLFVFPTKNRYSFWMKEMKFPLDFVWIEGNRVVEITEDVPSPKPDESPASLTPKLSVDKVLEVNAGVVDSSEIRVGDKIGGL